MSLCKTMADNFNIKCDIKNINIKLNFVFIITELISKLIPCLGDGGVASVPMNLLGQL